MKTTKTEPKDRETGDKISFQGTLATGWGFGRATVSTGPGFWRKDKMRQKRTGGRGYTIIEVMIFLAVSGFMFILAAVFINGKQAQVAFQQGMQASNATIVNAINTVANGEYPSMGTFSCSAPLGGGPPSFTSTLSGQGTNGGTNNLSQSGCIFMGKVLQFGYDESKGSSDPTSYSTYTVTGRQYAPTNGTAPQPVQTFADALPVAAIKSGVLDLTQINTLEQGLTIDTTNPSGQPVTGMYLCTNTCSNASQISGIGFFGSFGSYNTGFAASQSSGAQSVTVVALPSTNNIVNAISDLTGANPAYKPVVLSPGQYVVLCLNNGHRVGSVTIGGSNGQQTATSIDYNEDAPC